MITITSSGSFDKTQKWFNDLQNIKLADILNKYGKLGVSVLSANTPKDSGLAADSWDYSIDFTKGKAKLMWTNSDVEGGYANVVILLQYGHATKDGRWIEGIDFINPSIGEIFTGIADDIEKEVKQL